MTTDNERRFIRAGKRKLRGKTAFAKALFAVGGLFVLVGAPALAMACAPGSTGGVAGSEDKGTSGNSNGGGGNFGTVKLQTAGNCADVNAEFLNHGGVCAPAPIDDNESDTPRHTPHLPCADIELVGIKMRDASGKYTIDSIPPSGKGEQVYADSTHDASWTYNKAKGGEQVMDVINVQKLVANAIAAGAEAHPVQGYHFKLQFVQAPQKHKTFWVHCNAPVVTPSPSGSPTPSTNPSPSGTPTQQPEACPLGNAMISHYSYLVNGTTTVSKLENSVHPGDTVKVTFTLAANCSNEQVSFVSYKAPSASFDANTASQQQVFSQQTGTFSAGEHSLQVTIPGCFFQVDFVRGAVIEHLGPGNFYSTTDRLIDAENGGSTSCDSASPSPSPTGTTSPASTPSASPSGSPAGSPNSTPSASPSGSPAGTSTTPSSSPSGNSSGSTTNNGGGNGGQVAAAHTGQVAGASTTAPNTGRTQVLPSVLAALAMLVLGFGLVGGSLLKRKKTQG